MEILCRCCISVTLFSFFSLFFCFCFFFIYEELQDTQLPYFAFHAIVCCVQTFEIGLLKVCNGCSMFKPGLEPCWVKPVWLLSCFNHANAETWTVVLVLRNRISSFKMCKPHQFLWKKWLNLGPTWKNHFFFNDKPQIFLKEVCVTCTF